MSDNAANSVHKNAGISILGAGSWGMTLAWLLANNGHEVILYTRSQQKAQRLSSERTVKEPVKVQLPSSLRVTCDLKEAVDAERLMILACTSQTVRAVSSAMQEILAAKSSKHRLVIVSAVKGLELETLKRMSEVVSENIPNANVCALSGPNLADEILMGMPAATVVACEEPEVAAFVQSLLTSKRFRVYTNTDIVGVELGGSLKNIIAIAAGVSDELRLGANSKAALLTRGLAEMTRLSVTLGGQSSTLAGLAGMGDLFATSGSVTSRNYRLGAAIARGSTAKDAEASLGVVAEGVATTFAVCELAKRLNLDLPIASAVESMLLGKTTPEGAIMTLMSRPPVPEARPSSEKTGLN
ncbi:MAG TPA: NAD(P)H-dependent glycerol-3-phosphate dehydrogenase [Candidatus Melainabacteria bacterium]|nr:NAD(P)H-dependent glycerol-3-phosphate dehydrogenase [Candidatus Melainabacteria bacterium]